MEKKKEAAIQCFIVMYRYMNESFNVVHFQLWHNLQAILHAQMWQSRVEIEHYSLAYFSCIVAFEPL